VRDRLAELRLLHEREAGIPAISLRLQAEPERIGIRAHAELEERDAAAIRFALEHDVIFGPELALREVDVARDQPQDFRVLVGNDLEDDAIEVRERLAPLVAPPVPRIALEDQALPRLVVANEERADPHELRRGRPRVPRLAERARAQRRLELVL
jgi:hypothetical protein